MLYVKYYDNKTLPFNKKEALRYFGYTKGEIKQEEIDTLFEECILEAMNACEYRVVYSEFPISVKESEIDLSFTQTKSSSLSKNLKDCDKVVAFAATVGIGIDRLITRYEKVSPIKAYAFQAIGAERVETLADAFNREITEKYKGLGEYTRPRFSCGYGDFPLEKQRDFILALDCQRKIGVTLNESLLMSPSKSVTAVIGIGKTECREHGESCSRCEKTNCVFRKEKDAK